MQLSLEFSGWSESSWREALRLPNCTFRTQLASACRCPVFFWKIPRLDCSASKHRHVKDVADAESPALIFPPCCCPCPPPPPPCPCPCCCCCDCRYHRWSLALRVADNIWELGPLGALGSYGKLVRARTPHINRAASSYAWAASSAVSNVPNHTLVFLQMAQNVGTSIRTSQTNFSGVLRKIQTKSTEFW